MVHGRPALTAGWPSPFMGPGFGRHAARWRAKAAGRLAQLEEHFVYTEGVGGSSPSPPTIISTCYQTKGSGMLALLSVPGDTTGDKEAILTAATGQRRPVMCKSGGGGREHPLKQGGAVRGSQGLGLPPLHARPVRRGEVGPGRAIRHTPGGARRVRGSQAGIASQNFLKT